MISRRSTLRILHRLALLTVLIGAIVVTIGVGALAYHYRKTTEARVDSLVRISEMLQSLAASLDKKVASGAVTKEAALAQFSDTAMAMRYNGGADYVSVYTMDGTAIAVPDRRMIGQNRMDVETNGVRILRSITDRLKDAETTVFRYSFTRPGQTGLFPKISYASQFKPWNLLLIAGAYTDDIDEAFVPVAVTAGGILLVVAVVAGLLVVLVGRSITAPLGRLGARMHELAEGDLGGPVPGSDRGDEIGGMARSVEVFRQALLAKRDADALAARDADGRSRRAEGLDHLTRQFERQVAALIGGLSSAATELEATAATMTGSAERTIGRAAGVTASAQETAANVRTVAAASEEMAASIREIAGQVARSSEIAAQASGEARRTNVLVQGLAAGTEKVGDVVGLISGIAAQTNLLALNATIEAARAGEAGRGFAVVASEVKQLAEQTAKATESIGGQIAAIQGETRAAVVAIETIGRTIAEMHAIATSVSAAMEEQGAATLEIVRSVTQAAEGTQDVTVTIGVVREEAAQTGAASAQVLDAARELARTSAGLGQELDAFLAGVKAA
ncbi:methyl-accepting chemotaxis protein [Methylobacterium sp. JK268]